MAHLFFQSIEHVNRVIDPDADTDRGDWQSIHVKADVAHGHKRAIGHHTQNEQHEHHRPGKPRAVRNDDQQGDQRDNRDCHLEIGQRGFFVRRRSGADNATRETRRDAFHRVRGQEFLRRID